MPDVPETKKLMSFQMTANDGSSHSSINQHAANSVKSPNKSKMSVQIRTDGRWGDMKDYKPGAFRYKKTFVITQLFNL